MLMMYNMVMGRPLEEDHYWLHPTGEDFTQPEMLIGTYSCHEGIPTDLKVYMEDGNLKVADRVGEMTAKFCGETWFLTFREEPVPVYRLKFWVRNGIAWGVNVNTRLYQRVYD